MDEAFVIMPLGSPELENNYYEVILPILKSCDLEAKRVDKHNEGKLLKSEIVDFIKSAKIIIAELTNERPNCYLEIGYAMGLDKFQNLILMAREDYNPDNPRYQIGGPKVHFDLSGYDILFWDDDLDKFKEQLELRIHRRLHQINQSQKSKEPANATANLPEIYVNFKMAEEPGKSSGKIYPTYRINFKNEGHKLAEKINAYILIGSDSKIDTLNPSDGDISRLDIKTYNLEPFLEENRTIEVFEFLIPNMSQRRRRITFDIYPGMQRQNGNLAIYEKDIDKIKKIIAINIEDSGFVRQEFEVSQENSTKPFKEIKREFHPH